MSLYADLYEIADRVINPNFEDENGHLVIQLAESLYAICQAYEDTIEEEIE